MSRYRSWSDGNGVDLYDLRVGDSLVIHESQGCFTWILEAIDDYGDRFKWIVISDRGAIERIHSGARRKRQASFCTDQWVVL